MEQLKKDLVKEFSMVMTYQLMQIGFIVDGFFSGEQL